MAVAIYFHSTYLLPGALITLGFLLAIWQEERRWKGVLRHGMLTFLAVLPILFYAAVIFGPTSPDLYRQAQSILVHFRIPQHAAISAWMRWTVTAQALLLICALWTARKTRLFPTLMVSSVGMLLLTLIEFWTGNDSLALLFPWRISVILVPLSTTLLLSSGLSWIGNHIPVPSPTMRKRFATGCLIVISGLMVAGQIRSALDFLAAPDLSKPLLTFLNKNAAPGDTVLIPPKLETFRMESGVPAFVDLKSIPYRDTDVLEWYRRLQLVNQFYESGTDVCMRSREIAQQEGVNLLLIPLRAMPTFCPAWQVEYQDSDFSVVRPSTNSTP
jgi:hypothetical protein